MFYLSAKQMQSFTNGRSVVITRHGFNVWFFTAGYYGDGLNAIIVFAVCFMPESNQPNYRYIMENLFKWVFLWFFCDIVTKHRRTMTIEISPRYRYVIGTLELLVAENYMIVYLNGATSRKKMPTVGWLRKCYQQIDRRWVCDPLWSWTDCLSQPRTGPLSPSLQAQEELEVFHHCPPVLVYSHPAGNHKTFHQVRSVCQLLVYVYWNDLWF